MDCQKRLQYRQEVLLALRNGEWVLKSAYRYIHKLLRDLIADNALPGIQSPSNQRERRLALLRSILIKGVNEDVGV